MVIVQSKAWIKGKYLLLSGIKSDGYRNY